MRKIKFKIEYVPLSDERVERHKDFDKLMVAYTAHPKPSWKSRLFGNKFLVYTGGIITGAALASLLWWNANHLNENKISARENSPEYTGSKTEQVEKNTSGQDLSNKNSEQNSVKSQDGNAGTNTNSESEVKNEPATGENQNPGSESATEMNSVSSGNRLPLPEKNGSEKISPSPNHRKQPPAENNFSKDYDATSSSRAKKSDASKTSNQNVSKRTKQTTSVVISKTSSEKSRTSSTGKKSSANSNASAEKTSNRKSRSDTLVLQSESPDAKFNIPLSSLPPDSSKKGVHINFPKIDLNPSLHALANAADTAGKKIDSLFKKLFEKDSLKGEKPQEEISSSDSPADSSKKGVHINLPKIDLNPSLHALSNAADTIGKKIDSLITKFFEKDSLKEVKPQEEIPAPAPPADSFKHRYAQVTFVSPLSTDGLDGKDYMHNISFNILQGYTGALKGVEFGGLANVEKGYVTGAQFGGLTNYVFGDVKGAQFGGLVNYGKNLTGVQFSGLVGCVSGSVHGAQFGGIINIVPDTLKGLQVGGVLNLSLANKPSVAWQVGGAANLSLGDLHGAQIAGCVNVANKITGVQIGLVNVAKKATGFQLGLINITDSLDGEALGLISVSTNGIHNVDVFGSEILYGSAALKLGSPHIYTIFAAGAAPLSDVRLGLGIGVGGHFPFKKAFINLDGICWSIHNKNLQDWNEVNLWNQIRVMVGYQFTKGFSGYLGPTANAHVYNPIYPAIAPYTIYDSQGTTNVQGWIGFVVGLQFF